MSAGKPLSLSYYFAPGCLVLGLANLCRVAYYWIFFGTANSLMVGAGVALTVIGLMATYYAWDDYRERRLKQLLRDDEEELSPEEYERRFED